MGFILDGKDIGQPEIILRTFISHQIPSFKPRGRIKKHLHLVQHENAGSTDVFTIRNWLLKKGYGYHIIIDRQGTIHQHNDLLDKLWHASQCNGTGIGICLVSPYYPKNISPSHEAMYHPSKRYTVIDADWWTHCSPKSMRKYVQPTDNQLEALEKLIPFLCNALDVSPEYPTIGLNRKQRKIKGYLFRKRPAPGIVAHRDFSMHADGRFALEYLAAQKIVLDTCKECGRPL